jgi:hypothetical protein
MAPDGLVPLLILTHQFGAEGEQAQGEELAVSSLNPAVRFVGLGRALMTGHVTCGDDMRRFARGGIPDLERTSHKDRVWAPRRPWAHRFSRETGVTVICYLSIY